MTDFSIGENEPISATHLKWLGFIKKGSIWFKEGLGQVSVNNGKYYYKASKNSLIQLKTCKDLNQIYLKNYYEKR